MQVNVRELRKNLAEILDKAENGEEITITRKGKAVVKLISSKHQPGLDLEDLRAFRRKQGISLKHNPVLSLRKNERF
jgi:prevent-host-death family protein